MSFHRAGVGEERLTSIEVALAEGASPSQIVMGHSSSIAGDFALMKRILDHGVFIEFDYLGVIGGPGGPLSPRNDRTVLQGIVTLIEAGYADRIVLGHDICTKIQLKTYGGTGFSYISEYFLPELRRMGVSDEQIRKMMIDNPRRALTFTAPRPLEAFGTPTRQARRDVHDGPWLGTWKRRNPTPSPETWILKMWKEGDGIRYTIDVTRPTGSPTRMEAFVRFDGKPYRETGNPSADHNVFERIDDRTLRLIDLKDGKETIRFTITYSSDGKVRTSVSSRVNEKGETVTSTGVWDRVE
jgi:hypothetical protein